MVTAQEKEKAILFLQLLQQQDGGYAGQLSNPVSKLQDTLSSIKALKLLDSAPANVSKTVEFLYSCYDNKSGSFADQPGNKVSVFSTASALIALQDLETKDLLKEVLPMAMEFIADNATSPADHFMRIAAFEECKLPPPAPKEAISFFYSIRQKDGSFGDSTFLNAISCAAILRAGEKIENTQSIVQTILNAQHSDGSFHGENGETDLMTTYAAMRTLVLLDVPPNLSALKEYLFSLHHEQGGFGVKPNDPASAGGTYQVISIFKWIEEFKKQQIKNDKVH